MSKTVQIDGIEVTIRRGVSGTHPHFGTRSRQKVYSAVIDRRVVSEGHLTRRGAIEGAKFAIAGRKAREAA